MTLGKRLRTRRKALDLSQERLAAVCGVQRVFISLLECDKETNPGATYLIKFADALNTSTDYLLGRIDDPAFPLPCSCVQKASAS